MGLFFAMCGYIIFGFTVLITSAMIYDELYLYLSQLSELKEIDRSIIRDNFRQHDFCKGEFLTKEGEVCDSILFVKAGYFRVYVIDGIDERTVHLAGNRDFVSSFGSFMSQKPSQTYVQAINNATTLRLEYSQLQKLYDTYPRWEKLGRCLLEKLFARKEKRLISMIETKGEERYLELIEQEPELLQHVPLQYIASYLNIRPETLSRIRASIAG